MCFMFYLVRSTELKTLEQLAQEYVLVCDLDEIIFASKIIVVAILLLQHNDLILH